MEAMAVGVPVVTTFVSGIPELAIDGQTALVVPASNSDEMAGALGRLLEDHDLRTTVAGAAERLVRERHDVGPNVAVLRNLFSELSTTGSPPAAVTEHRCAARRDRPFTDTPSASPGVGATWRPRCRRRSCQ